MKKVYESIMFGAFAILVVIVLALIWYNNYQECRQYYGALYCITSDGRK